MNSYKNYTYTIFDANPHTSGLCNWPSHTNVKIYSQSTEKASIYVLDIMKSEGQKCDEYNSGDMLYALIWDESGNIVAEPQVTL